ncbi:hypothetical protein TMatcc_005486 [Talaromyces marneffei ATCC 18224]
MYIRWDFCTHPSRDQHTRSFRTLISHRWPRNIFARSFDGIESSNEPARDILVGSEESPLLLEEDPS